MVQGPVDGQGNRHEDQETMNHMVKEYFSYLFTSKRLIVDGGVLMDVTKKVIPTMNLLLSAPFSREEV